MEIFIDEKKNEIIREIALHHDLDLVVLFGSYARGRAIPESDIDIGVYKRGGVDYDLRLILIGEFSDLFKTDNVDVQGISSYSPILMYNILYSGKLLYQKEAGLFNRLKLYAWKLSAESKNFRDQAYRSLKNKILNAKA